MFPGDVIRVPNGKVLAVRGPMTCSQVADCGPVVFGDPGLLIREWVTPPPKQYLLGIVPHWSDREHPFLRSELARRSDVLLIDPCQDPLTVVTRIASCRFVLSSSLHGIVTSDAFGIPSLWMRFRTGHEDAAGASEFKFLDYFASWGHTAISPFVPTPRSTLDDYLAAIPVRDLSPIERMCTDLKVVFPFQKLRSRRGTMHSTRVVPFARRAARIGAAATQQTADERSASSAMKRVLMNPVSDAPLGIPSPMASVNMTPARCVVLVPFQGRIFSRCQAGLVELEKRGYVVRRIEGYSAIDQARNQLSSDALRDGFAETLWIDSDVAFDPNDVDKLRRHGLPIACGIYPKKGLRELAMHVLPGTERFQFGVKGGLNEILYAGAGFLHIRREAYDTITRSLSLPVCNQHTPRPLWPFFQPLVRSWKGGSWYLAEDYAFCHRARQSGLPIVADTTIRLWHIGDYGYSWEDAGIDRQRFSDFDYRFEG
jgi:Polysaccharide pyruvyl transferase